MDPPQIYRQQVRRDGERMLKVEYIDPFRQRSKAEAIYNKYKISDENILLVTQDDQRIIRQADLYAVKIIPSDLKEKTPPIGDHQCEL